MVDQLSLLRRRGDARREGGRHRGQARRPGRGDRRLRHLEGPDRERQHSSRTTSPTRCAPSPTSRPPSRRATSPRRSPSRPRARSPELAATINTMVDQLSSFAAEVTRVAREVGTEGKLGGQAQVKGVSGTWRDLTDNVNFMASSLTEQVRNIATVTTAVANGDLSKKITVDVKGEVFELKDTINTMVDQLRAFASEVTRVAREVGTEGRLGGQARVEGVSGHLARPDRQRQLHGLLADRAGAQHRHRHHRGRERRPLEEGDGRREGRGPGAEGHDQHDGRPALGVRRRGHPRRPRGRHRGHARRPGRGGRRLRHLEGPDREREPARRQPHLAGAEHRRRHDGGREGRPLPEDHRRGEGRGRPARRDDQHDGRPALHLRRRGDARRAGGRHRGQARRPGSGRGRLGRVEGADRQRQPARRDADDAAARDRGRLDGRDPGRPDAVDHRRGGRRGLGPQGQHQPDDRQPPRDDGAERRAGLAQLEPRPLLRDAPGPARPEDGRAAADERGDAARRGPPRRLLRRRGHRRGRGDGAAPDRDVRLQGAEVDREPLQGGRGDRRPGGAGEEGDRDHAGARGLHQDRLGARRGRPGEHHRPPRPVRGERDGGDGAGVVHAVHRGPADVPRPALRVDRGRPEHDPREHADRGAAAPVAAADAGPAEPVGGAAGAAGRAEAVERRARGADGDPARVRGAAPDPAGGAAADERGAGGALAAAGGAEPADRDQERGDRGCPQRARGEG